MPYGFLSNISKDEVKVKYGLDIQQNYQSRYRGCLIYLESRWLHLSYDHFLPPPPKKKPTRAHMLDSYYVYIGGCPWDYYIRSQGQGQNACSEIICSISIQDPFAWNLPNLTQCFVDITVESYLLKLGHVQAFIVFRNHCFLAYLNWRHK